MDRVFRGVLLNAARVLFIGTLAMALYASLNWALSIEPAPDAAAVAAQRAAEVAAVEASSEASAAPTTEEPQSETVPTAVEETVPPEELIGAAAAPGQTTVQLLDAGGGDDGLDRVRGMLESHGYRIVAENRSQRRYDTTTIFYVGDNLPQAEGLRAREPRLQDIEDNNGRLSDSVDLHVLIGRDF